MALLIRRGTDAERQQTVFAEGELVYTTDTKRVYIGDNLTPGGIFAGGTSSIINDTTPQLGGNLDLNAFEITGVGEIDIVGSISADTITAGAFIGDGSGLTNLPGGSGVGEGVVEGSNYRINIIGGDSTTIINSDDSTINSTVVTANNVNTFNSEVFNFFTVGTDTSQLRHRVLPNSTRGLLISETVINPSSQGLLQLTRGRRGTLTVPAIVQQDDIVLSIAAAGYDGVTDITSSVIGFTIDGAVTTGVVPGKIFLGTADADGVLDLTSGLHITASQRLGVMTDAPGETLDVNGNAIVRGFVQFGSYTDAEIAEITPANGMVYYNSTDNRFRGYQAGAWINLDDGTAA